MRISWALMMIGLTLCPTQAFAWNARGHMTVAGIAWNRMTPQAQRRAIQLLRRNPDYAAWVDGFPEPERDRIAFMEAATWADDLRDRVCSQQPGPTCIRDEGYTPADAEADQNIGYRDRRLRRYWHFKDLPYVIAGGHGEPPFRVNAETQIVAFSRSLAESGLDDEAKSYNLTWLLHLVGDVHQPLHATARFTTDHPEGDAGGNGVIACHQPPAECVTTGRRANRLHSLWDNALGTNKSPRAARAKADAILAELNNPRSFRSQVLKRSDVAAAPAVWFDESLRLAIEYVYAPPIGPGKGPYLTTAPYRRNLGSVAEQRVMLAGVRLARLLNERLS